MKCLAIVPAYNEEKSIYKVVKDIKKLNICDVVVINDDSRDNTSAEAKRAGAIVIDSIKNLGIGGAVQTGYKYAYWNDYDCAFQVDGDGQHDPAYIKDMIKKMEDISVDILIGSRFISRTGYKQTFFRKIGGNFISWLIKALSGKKIYDPLSGYRLVNKKIIMEFSKNYPTDYPEPETNLAMILKKYKIEEIPMEMKKRENGKSFVTPITAVWYMIKVSIALIIVRVRGGK